MLRTVPAAISLAVPLLLTACAGSPSPAATNGSQQGGVVTATAGAGGVQQVSIQTTDMFRFVPAVIHAHVGKLQIALSNGGNYPHNISFPDLHATSPTVSGNPGEQESTITVTFAHPGTYTFVCTFHSSAGMTGQVVVS